MRLIDADDFELEIRAAKTRAVCDDFFPCTSDYTKGMLSAIPLLRQQPTANEWIPVSEKLPEKDGEYYSCLKQILGIVM